MSPVLFFKHFYKIKFIAYYRIRVIWIHTIVYLGLSPEVFSISDYHILRLFSKGLTGGVISERYHTGHGC